MPKEEYGPVGACGFIQGMFTNHMLSTVCVALHAEDTVLDFTLFIVWWETDNYNHN